MAPLSEELAVYWRTQKPSLSRRPPLKSLKPRARVRVRRQAQVRGAFRLHVLSTHLFRIGYIAYTVCAAVIRSVSDHARNGERTSERMSANSDTAQPSEFGNFRAGGDTPPSYLSRYV